MDLPTIPCRLHEDVRIMRTGPHDFRIVDNRSGTNFKLSAGDRYLLSLLGERGSVDEVIDAYQSKFRTSLTAASVHEFIGQLADLGLLEDEQHSVGTKSDPALQAPQSLARNEMSVADNARVNNFFDVLTLLFGWLLHPIWLLVVTPTILLASVIIVRRWNGFYNQSLMLWSSHPFLPLLAASYLQTVFFETLPRSLMMGICCRRFGGRVRKFGLEYGKWVLPTVAFSTDIGESMILMTSRGRWTLIVSGVLVPMFLGALYVLGWAFGSRGSDLYLFWMLMIAPSALMIVFQANVFSLNATTHWGLAWAVDDWQLHSRALNETSAWLRGRRSPQALTPRERFWLRVYGVCSLTLRIGIDLVLFFGGGYFFTHFFGPTGAVAFLFMAGWWNRDHLKVLWRWTGYTPVEAWKNLSAWRQQRAQHSGSPPAELEPTSTN
jgi:hypothetical protein